MRTFYHQLNLLFDHKKYEIQAGLHDSVSGLLFITNLDFIELRANSQKKECGNFSFEIINRTVKWKEKFDYQTVNYDLRCSVITNSQFQFAVQQWIKKLFKLKILI